MDNQISPESLEYLLNQLEKSQQRYFKAEKFLVEVATQNPKLLKQVANFLNSQYEEFDKQK
jgi:lipopolysaccharide biosynthesis regulator YciM